MSDIKEPKSNKETDCFIGTCSWKYPSWKNLVYSKSDGINYLKEYSKKFNTVEVDQWFWSLFDNDKIKLPESDTVKEYIESVPENFKFTIKAPNSLTLTHHKAKKGEELKPNYQFLSPELTKMFLKTIHEMENQIGSIMLQFGYLNKQKIASPGQFYERLDNYFSQIQSKHLFSVETRNKNYLKKDYYNLLLKHQVSPVFLQGYWMPPIWETFESFKDQILQFDKVIIRLHGDDREGIEKLTHKKWNSIVNNRDNELEQVSKMIKEIRRNKAQVYINVNNHYEGSAPLTIKKLEALLHLEDELNS